MRNNYSCLHSLAEEIIAAKLKETRLRRTMVTPFFRENHRTGDLELVMIPVRGLTALEREVLEVVGYPKKPVRINGRLVTAFVINAHDVEGSNPSLSEVIARTYRSLLG